MLCYQPEGRQLISSAPFVGSPDVVVSPALLGELRTVLAQPKFRRFLSMDEVDAYVDELARLCQVVDDPPTAPGVTRDPKDDYVIASAHAVHAAWLVSGDKDILEADLDTMLVLRPREAADRLT